MATYLSHEFQDISGPRASRFHYYNKNPRCALFAVDWQAIYRFSMDIAYTLDFATFFGNGQMTALDKTFRFNNKISSGQSFYQQNPQKYKSNCIAIANVNNRCCPYRAAAPEQSMQAKQSYRGEHTGINTGRGIADTEKSHSSTVEFDPRLPTILNKIDQQCSDGQTASVFILARFSFYLPTKQALALLQSRYANLQLRSQTIHTSFNKPIMYCWLV